MHDISNKEHEKKSNESTNRKKRKRKRTIRTAVRSLGNGNKFLPTHFFQCLSLLVLRLRLCSRVIVTDVAVKANTIIEKRSEE
jgi:hypothetical protein